MEITADTVELRAHAPAVEAGLSSMWGQLFNNAATKTNQAAVRERLPEPDLPEAPEGWLLAKTRACPYCGRDGFVLVRRASYEAWDGQDLNLRRAFPELDASEREQVTSGFHSACWDAVFGANHEDDDDEGWQDWDEM